MARTPRATLRLSALTFAATAAVVGCAAGGGTGRGDAELLAPEATTFQYAPFAVAYRLASHSHAEQEFGGQVGATDYATAIFLSTSAALAPSGRVEVSLRVDSLRALGALPPGVREVDLHGLRGAVFRGTMAASGEITEFEAGEGSGPLLDQLNQSMQRFFPVIPDRGAAPGQKWTDSSTAHTESQGTDLEIKTVTAYAAGDWVERDAVRILPVTARADYTLSGSGEQGGAEFVIEGTGVSWIQILFADDGSLFKRTSADTMSMTASILSLGTVVPVSQVRTDSLVVVP